MMRRVKREQYENRQAEFPRTRFSVDDILSEHLATTFRDIEHRPQWAFIECNCLGFIRMTPRDSFIGLHYLLNHPDTPYEVMWDIIGHELLHLRFRPREIDGKSVSHPPEFREAENVILPGLSFSFDWCISTFLEIIDVDSENERTWIDRRRAQKRRESIRPSLEETTKSYIALFGDPRVKGSETAAGVIETASTPSRSTRIRAMGAKVIM